MDIIVLLILAPSGLSAVSSHAGRPYHFVYERKNMTEAQSYCREKYTDLATIDNMEDVETLMNIVNLSQMVDSTTRAWIGLYDDLDSWRWSLSDTSFYKDGETEFRRWLYGQPNNANSNEHCTVSSNGYWHDYSCKYTFKAVCMDVTGSTGTFVLTNISMTWTEAQSYCREHHTDLVSVRNMTENQKVQELIPASEIAWIGLFRDSWKWSDGSNSSFRDWKTGEPTGWSKTCVSADFSISGRWRDEECDSKKAFICYGPAPTTQAPTTQAATTQATTTTHAPTTQATPKQTTTKQVIRLKVKSSVDLNDPAVMEDMLKQLKQKLKDQGLNDDIKLSWKKQPDGKVFHKEEKKTKKKKPIHDEL